MMSYAGPQVQLRCKCPFCRNAELETLAQSLGQAHTPVACPKCQGTGFIMRWVDLVELAATLHLIGGNDGPGQSADHGTHHLRPLPQLRSERSGSREA